MLRGGYRKGSPLFFLSPPKSLYEELIKKTTMKKKNEVLTAASETCGKLSQTLVAVGVVVGIVGWILSGLIKPTNNNK